MLVIHVQCARAIAQGRPWVRGGMRASSPTVMRYGRTIAIRRNEGIPPYGTERRSELCRAKKCLLIQFCVTVVEKCKSVFTKISMERSDILCIGQL